MILRSSFMVCPDAARIVNDYYLPAALPALRRMYSPLYFTPFPLYGSGFLRPLILAATCPRSCLSEPSKKMRGLSPFSWVVLTYTSLGIS